MNELAQNEKGHYGELIGCAWLIRNGYWVFRNVSPHGVIDAVAVHRTTGEKLLIDFKCISKRKNGWIRSRVTNAHGKAIGVRIMYVDIETHDCRIVQPKNLKEGKE